MNTERTELGPNKEVKLFSSKTRAIKLSKETQTKHITLKEFHKGKYYRDSKAQI